MQNVVIFQSTLPRRERLALDQKISVPILISIHAPAKGATVSIGRTTFDQIISIHAPAKGATVSWTFVSAFCNNFNPRSREGSDLHCIPLPICSTYFNPRSREGSDCTGRVPHRRWYTISIHAPAKGATRTNRVVYISLIISIHAPAKGATICGRKFDTENKYFNPRSREGSDNLWTKI